MSWAIFWVTAPMAIVALAVLMRWELAARRRRELLAADVREELRELARELPPLAYALTLCVEFADPPDDLAPSAQEASRRLLSGLKRLSVISGESDASPAECRRQPEPAEVAPEHAH